MTSRECPTCCEEYDVRERRIRILHCGHSQCTACMQAQFLNGQITCAACRATHRYPNFSSIPVCYVAEKIWEDMDKSKIQENLFDEREALPQVPTLHRGICVEHDAFKLFWCNTHQEWICTHCSVVEHPRGDCVISPIRKKLENGKDLIESNISEELKDLDNTKRNIKSSIKEVEKQSKDNQDKIKTMKEEMGKIKLSISQTEKEVTGLNSQKSKLEAISIECTEKKSTLENIITRLHDVRNFKELDAESGKSASMINRYKIWRKELKEQYLTLVPNDTKLHDILGKLKKVTNTQQKNTIIREAKKILHENVNRSQMYAAKTIRNTLCYSLIEQRDECIILNDLQNNLSPDSNAMILEFDDMMCLIPNEHVVFMTLAHKGTTIGCLHISLNGPPGRVKQFLELSSASTGHGGYRKAHFNQIWDKGQPGERINCEGFIDNNGCMKINALFELDGKMGAPHTEGTVYGSGSRVSASFAICTRTMPSSTIYWVAIGQVIKGLSELKTAINKYKSTDILISKCGLVIDNCA